MSYVTKYEKDRVISIFIPCDCTGEILKIEYDHDSGLADLCIYTSGAYANKMSLWQKLRYIWQVLVYSKPFGDQMVLRAKQLKELKRFLISIGQ